MYFSAIVGLLTFPAVGASLRVLQYVFTQLRRQAFLVDLRRPVPLLCRQGQPEQRFLAIFLDAITAGERMPIWFCALA